MIIGLTGGIASGKSTVAKLFEEHGFAVIGADAIVKTLTEPNKPAWYQIIELLGDDVVQADQTLDRDLIRQRIFSDARLKHSLESILHPLVKSELLAWSEAQPEGVQIWEIPLLLETQSQSLVDRVLVVDCATKLQRARLQQRDQLNDADIDAVLAQQLSRADRLALADDIIVNDRDLNHLEHQIAELATLYQQLQRASKVGSDCCLPKKSSK